MSAPSLSASIFGKQAVEESKISDTNVLDLFNSPDNSLPQHKPTKQHKSKSNNQLKTETKTKTKRKRKESRKVDDTSNLLDERNDETQSISNKDKKGRKTKDGVNSDESVKKDAKTDESEGGNGADDDKKQNSDTDLGDKTIFVGNLPINTTRKSLAALFKSCGKVESSRLRSIATEGVKLPPEAAGNQKLVKKVSVNTNKIIKDSSKTTSQGYVVFDSQSSVEKALRMNNQLIPNSDGLYFRVDHSKPSHDSTRSVFIGNLPYAADETTLRKHFENECGWDDNGSSVENVRIVRDSSTMLCKGFGYLLLQDRSKVADALKLHESTYMKRSIRVMVCGKRFKSRRGGVSDSKKASDLGGAAKRVMGKIKKDAKTPARAAMLGSSVLKKKRGIKKVVATKGPNGISKRASTEKKLDKRMKQMHKRVTKGMGKSKNR